MNIKVLLQDERSCWRLSTLRLNITWHNKLVKLIFRTVWELWLNSISATSVSRFFGEIFYVTMELIVCTKLLKFFWMEMYWLKKVLNKDLTLLLQDPHPFLKNHNNTDPPQTTKQAWEIANSVKFNWLVMKKISDTSEFGHTKLRKKKPFHPYTFRDKRSGFFERHKFSRRRLRHHAGVLHGEPLELRLRQE